MDNIDTIQTISSADLSTISGGGLPKWVKPVAKFVGKKVLGPVGAAWTGYDAVDGYLTAREHGKGVLDSIKDGAINAVF